MKRLSALVLIFVLALSVSSFAILSPSDWAQEEFDAARLGGILPRSVYTMPKSLFSTREQFCELIMSAYESVTGAKLDVGENPFTDTNNPAVTAAASLGIVSGVGDGLFLPDRPVQRQEAAKMMYELNAAMSGGNMPAPLRALRDFSDEAEISDWAKKYVAAMYNANIMLGNSDGTFAPSDTTTIEQSVLMMTRLVCPEPLDDVVITELDTRVDPEDELSVSFETDAKGTYTVIFKDVYRGHEIVRTTKNKTLTLPGGMLYEDGIYSVFIEAGGVYSPIVTVYTSGSTLKAFYKLYDYTLNIAFPSVPDADKYIVTVQEARNSYYPDTIAPKEPDAFTYDSAGVYSLSLKPNRLYTITVKAGEEQTEFTLTTPQISTNAERKAEIFPEGEFTSEEEAAAQMITLKLPVWNIKDGKKVSSTIEVTVHEKLADKVQAVFEEIYEGDEQFPIYAVSAYTWRPAMASGRYSEHNFGTAIDINPEENYCVYKDGSTVGKYWKPYEDPYSVTPYGDVMTAFERHGFVWGGDAWASPQDYMHFSYLGT